MRRLVPALTLAGLLLGLAVVAQPVSAAPSTRRSLTAGHALHQGERIVSANHRYYAGVQKDGRLVVRASGGRWVWGTPKAGPNARLYLGRGGRLVLISGGHVRWSARTGYSGSGHVLWLRGNGALVLSNHGLRVWTSRLRTRCPHNDRKTFVIDLGDQVGRMCKGGHQMRVTPVTTGATARGDGTPKGIWRVQARVRRTTLYPAAGGAYPVQYWVPYDGAWGIHDSSWQHFAYGSKLYRTRGSHGCTHVPLQAMTWFFNWARVGSTTVKIRA